jgi:hypothetical protein
VILVLLARCGSKPEAAPAPTGDPSVVARGVRGVASYRGYVYRTDYDGKLWRSAESSGGCATYNGEAPELVAQVGGVPADGIAVDEHYIYVSDIMPGSSSAGFVVRLAKEGATPTTFVEGSDLRDARVDGGELFVARGRTLFRVDQGRQQAVTEIGASHDFAIDASSIVWTSSDEHALRSAPRAGGPILTILADAGEPTDLALIEDAVYYIDIADDSLHRVSRTGGASERVQRGVRHILGRSGTSLLLGLSTSDAVPGGATIEELDTRNDFPRVIAPTLTMAWIPEVAADETCFYVLDGRDLHAYQRSRSIKGP